jgi:hypothetical protein
MIALFSLGYCLLAGCSALASGTIDEPPTPEPSLDDGLPESHMVFLGITPDRWEVLVRSECEEDPAGNGCSKLFVRAADRIRWGVKREDAPELLIPACTQGHRPSCAALDLLQSPTLDTASTMARIGCPKPMMGNECGAAADLLAYSCNEKRQAVSCLALADLFAKAAEPDPVWTNRYRARACAYGGFCSYQLAEAPAEHAAAPE